MKSVKRVALVLVLVVVCFSLVACDGDTSTAIAGSTADRYATQQIANNLAERQPTPTDIEYSLERYNLIRRAYWVNGMREKANALPCEIEKPLGYIVLFSGNATFGQFVVDGKVSSLNSYLSPDSEWYEQEFWGDGDSRRGTNDWLADVDGSYGENDNGIFFFTPDGKYVEWTGDYLYSDIPFTVNNPVVYYEVK